MFQSEEEVVFQYFNFDKEKTASVTYVIKHGCATFVKVTGKHKP